MQYDTNNTARNERDASRGVMMVCIAAVASVVIMALLEKMF